MPIDMTVNTPSETATGGITGLLSTSLGYAGIANLEQTGQAGVALYSAHMIFTLHWQPLNGDWVHYPAPPKVVVCTRRRVICNAATSFTYITYTGNEGSDPSNTFNGSGYAHIDVTGTMAGRPNGATATSPGNGTQTNITSDEPFVPQVLNVTEGTAQTSFDINSILSLTMANNWILGFYGIQGTATTLMDFCVAGFDLARFGSHLNGVSGGHTDGSEDPSFTRWLPLAFSPSISSQPFRNHAGALPAPWGNVNCTYSIAMRREANPANPDLEGQTELYIPTGLGVYTGDGQTLLHQESYIYGGFNGDSVVATQKGATIASYLYADDSYVPDPQGNSIPRLTSTLLGNSADTSSSDNGQSIQGIFQYTWGPLTQGYGAFDKKARTNTVTDPLGNLTLVEFGLTGDIIGALNRFTVTAPDYAGTPAGSNVSNTYYYPSVTNPTQVLSYDPINNLGLRLRPWESDFDLFGNLITAKDPLLNTWSFVYDAAGLNLLSMQDPTGETMQFLYGENFNPANLLTSVHDSTGATRVQWNYNIFGQPLTQTVPAGASASGVAETTALNYNPITGDLIGMTDPLSNQVTINSYDPLGDPLSMSLFPDTGNPATSLTPLTSMVVWDAAQQLVKAFTPNGVQTQGFRTNGVLTDVQVRAPVAAGGNLLSQVHYDYDSRGRVYNVADLLGTIAQYRFDKNSNPTRVLDAAGHATQFHYRHNNELTSMTWPDQQHSRYVFYDSAGRVQSTVDEKFTLVQYLYDEVDRVTDIRRPATPAQNVHITYDAAGRPLTVSDGTGKREYTYDPTLHRILRVRTTFNALPAGSNVFDIGYTYYDSSYPGGVLSGSRLLARYRSFSLPKPVRSPPGSR